MWDIIIIIIINMNAMEFKIMKENLIFDGKRNLTLG